MSIGKNVPLAEGQVWQGNSPQPWGCTGPDETRKLTDVENYDEDDVNEFVNYVIVHTDNPRRSVGDEGYIRKKSFRKWANKQVVSPKKSDSKSETTHVGPTIGDLLKRTPPLPPGIDMREFCDLEIGDIFYAVDYDNADGGLSAYAKLGDETVWHFAEQISVDADRVGAGDHSTVICMVS